MRRKQKRNKPTFIKKTICPFCTQKTTPDYKDPEELLKVISPRGKIMPRERTGVCAKHQKLLAHAIKNARHLALLPFVVKNK